MAFAELIAVVRPIAQAPSIASRTGAAIPSSSTWPEEGISCRVVCVVEDVMPDMKICGILICLANMPDVAQTHHNSICLKAEDIKFVVASNDGFSSSPFGFIGASISPNCWRLRRTRARALLCHGVQIETSGNVLHDIDAPEDLPGWRPATPR